MCVCVYIYIYIYQQLLSHATCWKIKAVMLDDDSVDFSSKLGMVSNLASKKIMTPLTLVPTLSTSILWNVT